MDILRRRLMVAKDIPADDGHQYVDLGLPSGLMWATCNIGADSPEEVGLYFSWGNVDGHTANEGYDFGTSPISGAYTQTNGYTAKNNLSADQSFSPDSGYDAARENWGNPWRMPTHAEFIELYDNCTYEAATVKGINGMMLTSKTNGNTLFIPYAGYCEGTALNINNDFYLCSSTLNSKGSRYAQNWVWGLTFSYNVLTATSTSGTPQARWITHSGVNIRPVRYAMQYVDLGLPSGIKWATCNLGSGTPEGYGLYFTWGDLVGYAYGSGHAFSQANYNATYVNGSLIKNIATDLSLKNDAANYMLGGHWRMPSWADFNELISNCTVEGVTQNGVYGLLFTSNINGNTVFIPRSGSYVNGNASFDSTYTCVWTKSYISSSGCSAFFFSNDTDLSLDNRARYTGYSIRPVNQPTKTVTFHLTTTDNSSNAGVSITITDDMMSQTLTTNSSGNVTAEVLLGTVKVAASNYALGTKSFTVTDSTTTINLSGRYVADGV